MNYVIVLNCFALLGILCVLRGGKFVAPGRRRCIAEEQSAHSAVVEGDADGTGVFHLANSSLP